MAAEKLDDALLAEIEAYAVNIARQAGQILGEQFRKPLDIQFKDKKNRDPVTIADHLSDEYLKKAILEKFPSHLILSEEGGALPESDSPFVWVLDPLDGTVNYMNGLPLYAVSIGVLWKRQPVVGSIYVPVSHLAAAGVYHARLGKGAFLNSEKIAVCDQPSRRPLAGFPVHPGSRFRLSGESRKDPLETRNLGSIAVEIIMAASGVLQYAVFGRPRIWDVAAGVILVKEAGGLSCIRSPGAKDWQMLEQFQMKSNNDSEALESLRNWAFPIAVGAPESTRKIIKDIRIRRNPLSAVVSRFRKRRK